MKGLVLAAALLLTAGVTQAEILNFTIPMDGTQEVPGPGDPDGSGVATLAIDTDTNTIDWLFEVENISLPLTGAHIHEGAFGVAGGVLVNFDAQLQGEDLFDADLAAIAANPSGYYVNLHTSKFTAGAIRGQLPEPASLGMLALGAAVAGLRRRVP